MRALSWRQPFASAMLVGKVETRTWATNYRGLVLICASQQPSKAHECFSISGMGHFFGLMKKLAYIKINHIDLNGRAIAVGRLINCRPMIKEDEAQCFVKYQPGLWCHFYDDVKPIKPIPWKGTQGWKKVPQEIIEQIEYL